MLETTLIQQFKKKCNCKNMQMFVVHAVKYANVLIYSLMHACLAYKPC